MRILLTSCGSQGDLQPCIIAALTYRKAGHSVMISGSSNFRGALKKHNIPFIPATIDYITVKDIVDKVTKNAEEVLHQRYQNEGVFKKQREILYDKLNKFRLYLQTYFILDVQWKFFEIAQRYNPDLIISVVHSCHPVLAQALNKPMIDLEPAPIVTSPYFASEGIYSLQTDLTAPFPVNFKEKNINYYISQFFDDNAWRGQGLVTTNNRIFAREFNLAEIPPFYSTFYGNSYQCVPMMYFIDQTLFHHFHLKPPTSYFVGYPTIVFQEDFVPPTALVEFLENGEPPICVGFGNPDSPLPFLAREDMFLKAANDTNQRIIFITSLDLSSLNLPDTAFVINFFIPHAWLYPRCKAIVNHAGTGSFHAAISSGKPCFFVPHEVDQPCWGGIATYLKVGPPMLNVRILTHALVLNRFKDLIKNYDQYHTNCQNYLKKLIKPDESFKLINEIAENMVKNPPDWSNVKYHNFKTLSDSIAQFPYF